jgi:hypothetical protein
VCAYVCVCGYGWVHASVGGSIRVLGVHVCGYVFMFCAGSGMGGGVDVGSCITLWECRELLFVSIHFLFQ